MFHLLRFPIFLTALLLLPSLSHSFPALNGTSNPLPSPQDGTIVSALNQTSVPLPISIGNLSLPNDLILYRVPNTPITLGLHSFGAQIPYARMYPAFPSIIHIIGETADKYGDRPIHSGWFRYQHDFLNHDQLNCTVSDFHEMGRPVTYTILLLTLRGVLGFMEVRRNYTEVHFEIDVDNQGGSSAMSGGFDKSDKGERQGLERSNKWTLVIHNASNQRGSLDNLQLAVSSFVADYIILFKTRCPKRGSMASSISTTRIPIAQLRPDLDAKDATSITGIVTLIWPYASLTHSLSLLLVEPDFRQRRHRGQVRIHFHGSSAKAIAHAGVNSGDQLVLSLIGADWEKDGVSATTPGRGIEWELQYAERMVLQIHRPSEESTSLDIDHPPASPRPESPMQTSAPRHSPPYNSHIATSTRRASHLEDTQAWSSPAFLKRVHILASSYDPFAEEAGDFPDNERRKKTKFGRGSGEWRFAERTPSAEKEEPLFAAGLVSPLTSPTRRANSVNLEAGNPPSAEKNAVQSEGLHTLGGEEMLENPDVFSAEQIFGLEAIEIDVAVDMPQVFPETPAPEGSVSSHATSTKSPLPSEHQTQPQKDDQYARRNERAEFESPLSVVSAASSSVRDSASDVQTDDHSELESEEEKSDAVYLSRPTSEFGLDGSVFSLVQRGPEIGFGLSQISEEAAQQRAAVHLLDQSADEAHVFLAESSMSKPEIEPKMRPEQDLGHKADKDDAFTHSESDSRNSIAIDPPLLTLTSSRHLQIPEPQQDPNIHASDPATANVKLVLDEETPQKMRGADNGMERNNDLGGQKQTLRTQAQDTPLQNLGRGVDLATQVIGPTNVKIVDLESDEDGEEQLSQKEAQCDEYSHESSYAETEGRPLVKTAEVSAMATEPKLEHGLTGALTDALGLSHGRLLSKERDQENNNVESGADVVTGYMTEVSISLGAPTKSRGRVNGDVDVEATSSVEEKPLLDIAEGRKITDEASRSDEQTLREQAPEAEASQTKQHTYPKHNRELPSTIQDSYETSLRSRLVTPDATQETSFEFQPSTPSLQFVPDNDTLPTPRLTQGTSPGILPLHSQSLSKRISSVQQLSELTGTERTVAEQSSQLTIPGPSSQTALPEQPSQLTVLEQSQSSTLLEQPSKQEEHANTVLPATNLDPEESLRRKKMEEIIPPQTPRIRDSSLIQRLKEIRSQSSQKSRSRMSDSASAVSPWFAPRRSSPAVPDSDAGGVTVSPGSDQEFRRTKPSDTTTRGKTLAKSFIRSPPPQSMPLSTTSSPLYLPPSQPMASGFRTSISYFAPLASLSSHYGTLTDVLVIAISARSVTRAMSGARDYNQTIYVTDTSSNPPHKPISLITAQIFRARKDCFPLISLGDAILLRNFTVQSFNKRIGLLSTDASAWAVFRRNADVQIRGPPVEFGPEERAFARGHWNWWNSLSQDHKDELVASVPKEKTQRKGIEGLGEDLAGFRPKSRKSKVNGAEPEAQSKSNKLSPIERSLTLDGPVESDLDKTATQRRVLRPRNGKRMVSESPENGDVGVAVEHELRDGTKYSDRNGVEDLESRNELHELRDGRTYRDKNK